MILSLWSLGYLVLTIVAAVLAFVVLEGDVASQASGWFIVSILVFLVSIPMSKKK
jgi:uncharacterized membrane protein YtjA (UPF0391 family)